MTTEVYVKDACVACTRTKKTLDKRGIEYVIKQLSDPAELEFVKSLNIAAAPAVVIRDAQGELVDSWGGFNLDKIDSITA